ncbi:MAG: DUF2889 domain-containing protein [Halieaceae bacterium]|nr:DUF2889 domain-containing protein [Halieaceae bacterium]
MTLPLAKISEFEGYRRSIRIDSDGGARSFAELEDDIHAFAVALEHDGSAIQTVEVDIRRAPWTTCPGAEHALKRELTGMLLADVRYFKDRQQQCTHLFDLASWAAAHAAARERVEYDVLVSDPIDSVRHAEIWRNGELVLEWDEMKFTLQSPPAIAGRNIFEINDWMKGLSPELQEAARILRWGNVVANGRMKSLAEQSDATKMPPNCYTFQPKQAEFAKRIGEIRDFSFGTEMPFEL